MERHIKRHQDEAAVRQATMAEVTKRHQDANAAAAAAAYLQLVAKESEGT